MSNEEKSPLLRTEKLKKFLRGGGCLLYAAAVLGLYYQYVPRVRGLQAFLVPLLLLAAVSTLISMRAGTLVVVFLIPLVNSLPYFFRLPGFHPLLFIFLAFFLGILLHRIRKPVKVDLKGPMVLPVAGASAVLVVSALLTAWRTTNFFPLRLNFVPDFAVNVLNSSSGEALRRILFDSLNFLAGFVWFFVVVNVLGTKKTARRAIMLLALSSLLSFGFGTYQDAANSGLGNQSPFIESFRINGLFTDPNALGVFLALAIPVLAGAFLSHRGGIKLLFLLAVLAGALCIPDAGSRVGMMGVVLAFAFFAFWLVRLGVRERKRNPRITRLMTIHAAASVLAVGLIMVYVAVSNRSALEHRIGENIRALRVLRNPMAREIILHGRHLTWPAALRMIGEFPLSGTGAGSFTAELPNYYKKYGIAPVKSSFYYREVPPPDFHVDTAGNYYLHVGAETGLIGLFFFGWIFFLVLKHIFRTQWKQDYDPDWSFLSMGLAAAVPAMLVIFLFGVHTLNFEIQMTFWLFVGLLFAIPPSEKEPSRSSPLFKVTLGIAIGVFTLVHAWNSSGRLSLPGRTELFHLEQTFGLYQSEVMDGRLFRWTGGNAGMTVKVKKPVIVVPIKTSHPDIGEHPVKVRMFATQTLFAEKAFLEEVALKDNAWHEFRFDFSDRVGEEFLLYFEVSRTWRPGKETGSRDQRELGIAVGEPLYQDLPVAVETEARKPGEAREGEESVGESETAEDPGKAKEAELRKKTGGETAHAFDLSGWTSDEAIKPAGRPPWCATIALAEGSYLFRLKARGRAANGEKPLLALWIDGRLRGEEWVDGRLNSGDRIEAGDWELYLFRVRLKKGDHRICVEFMNEAYIHQTREFRKLFVESLEIIEMIRKDT